MTGRIHPSERADAVRFGVDHDAEAFVARQRAARLRVALLSAFYTRYPCRMGALHQLAGAGIAVARFAGRSPAYDAIGDGVMPVDRDGRPRTAAWQAYVAAFDEGCPADLLEERWLAAHLADMEQVKGEGWVEAFAAEHDAHRHDPSWDDLAEHMAVTLGTRVQDAEALSGRVALETAMATSLAAVVRRQLGTGLGLVRTFAWAAARGVVHGGPHVGPGLPSDRRLVWGLVRQTAALLRITRVFRLGVRRRARGAAPPPGSAWSLAPALAAVTGDDHHRIEPRVADFFDRMDAWRTTASVHLYHRAGRWAAALGTLLVGQGMDEEDLVEVDARFRLFRRDDGSLHFVREFWCADAVRVFDSDFVVRDVDGQPTILEVFQDLGVAARMRTTVEADGGVTMAVVGLFVRGVPLGVGPVRVCFTTRPEPERLVVQGTLDLAPARPWSRWFWHRLLGLPARVGEIRYYAVPREPGRSGSSP
ncbi:MAG: hypothetical protein R3F59_36105 [Myxococcota bacterium]